MGERSMRCEEVRDLIPEHVGDGYPRPVQAHLAACTACALEESRYAGLMGVVRGLREEIRAPAGFAERTLDRLERRTALRGRVRRLAHDPRTRYAAVGFGGAMVGAAAIALMLRRSRRRATLRAA